jgi:polysaccharide export outer membrane protein
MTGNVWQGLRLLPFCVVLLLTGCGSSGTRMISNTDGDVIRGEIDFSEYSGSGMVGEYQIGHGDQIDITFLYNSEYNVSDIKVRPDGRISLPLTGEVLAAGMTPAQLDSIITERYSVIVKEPEVSVILKEFAADVVYVLGEVGAPGAYEIDRQLTLLGALSKSRGMNKEAKKGSVLVIRRVSSDRIIGIQFDTNELLEEGRFDLDIPLKPNDIVYVPKSTLYKAEEFASVVYNIIEKPANLYLKGWQISQIKWLYEFYKATAQNR